MTRKIPSKEVRRQRWLEFADFMDSIKEEKFNHGEWCKPDHTCKTTACVAGWGAIQYIESVKQWLELEFDIQRLEIKSKSIKKHSRFVEVRFELDKLRKESYDTSPDNSQTKNSWHSLGREGLYLNSNTAEVLFYPYHLFWIVEKHKSPITSKDIALIFRYMATFKGRLGLRYNREKYKDIVDNFDFNTAI